MAAPDITQPEPRTELASNAVSGLGVLSQGLAAAAPSVALAGVPASLFLITGKGAVWASVIGAVIVFLIAFLISTQARRTVSSGSLGTYAGNGLGPGTAFAAGWGLIIGYVGFAAAGVLGAVLYFNSFLEKFGFDGEHLAWKLVLLVLVLAIAVYVPVRGVSVSVKFGLGFEVLSLTVIAVIIVAAYLTQGAHLDTAQFSLSHLGNNTTFIASVTAVGSYAGFESAASLGHEARDAHRSVARAILRLVLILAVLYLLCTYPEITGLTGLDPDKAALPVVADNSGVSWTTYVIGLSIGIADLVFTSAVINSGARSLFTLSREGALPPLFTRVNSRRAPSAAIWFIGAVCLVLGVAGTVSSAGRLKFDTYLAVVANWGYLVAYLLVAIATPLWLRKIRALRAPILVVAVLATLAIGYVMYRNLFPIPRFPYSILPYVFLALLALGVARYGYLRRRRPDVAQRIGTLQILSDEERERLTELDLLDAAGRVRA